MSIDRTKPYESKLRWVPLVNPERPEPYSSGILLYNPCEGASAWEWNGEYFYKQGDTLRGIGSATHWAVIEGPEPSDDVNINWKLYQPPEVESTGGSE